jgi:glutamyl-tRNA synthetase
MAQISASLRLRARSLDGMLDEFEPARLPREPWIYGVNS